MKKKERATVHLRIYPSSHAKLRTLAYKKRLSIVRALADLLKTV